MMRTAVPKFFIDNPTVVRVFKEPLVSAGKAMRIMAQFVGDCIVDNRSRNTFFGEHRRYGNYALSGTLGGSKKRL